MVREKPVPSPVASEESMPLFFKIKVCRRIVKIYFSDIKRVTGEIVKGKRSESIEWEIATNTIIIIP